MKHLDELRLELLRNESDTNIARGIAKGFDALLTALSEQAGEFDDEDADRESRNVFGNAGHTRCCEMAFVDGARRQFDRDRARIGLIKAQHESLMVLNRELQARLAAEGLSTLKKQYERTNHLDDTRENAVINNLIERCERLQEQYQTKVKMYCAERDRANVAEARLAESERQRKDLCESFDEMQKLAQTGWSRGIQEGKDQAQDKLAQAEDGLKSRDEIIEIQRVRLKELEAEVERLKPDEVPL